MAVSTDQMKTWLDDNPDKAGTPDFVKVTEAYSKATGGSYGLPQDTPYSDVSGPAGVGMSNTMLDQSSRTDPNTPLNIARRVGVSAATGLPDLGIAALNASARWGRPEGAATQLPYLGPMALKATGGLPMAEDASTTQQLLEGGASALLGGGGAAIARTVAAAPTALRQILGGLAKTGSTVVAPTIAGHKGAEYGAKIAETFGWDQETGALLGSIIGGMGPGAVGPAASRFTDWRYRDMGKPNAPEIAARAAREGVTLPASALGNDTIRLRENAYANRWGASGFTQGRRTDARNQTGAAWDDMVDARGSVNPTPTRGEIGADVGGIAQRGALEGNRISSAGQESLQQRIGPNTAGDIEGLLQELRRIANSTDAITARPIEARIAALESRLPPVDPETGVRPHYDTPYQQLKDSRTGTRVASEGVGGVPGRYAGQVEDAHTTAMRDIAAQQGVPPNVFDIIQQRSARLTGEGGPVPRLTELSDQVANNAPAGYNFLKRGEQDPRNLRLLESTQQPEVPMTFGDHLRLIGNETINSPNQGAPGPRQLATRIEGMADESRRILTGPQDQRAQDIAMLARALNAPTRQGGLGQTMGQLTEGVPGALTAGEVGSSLGHATGISGAPTAGRILGYATGPVRRAIGGRIMQGPTAMNALAGGPRAVNYTLSDLIAAITSASTPQTQGMPLPPITVDEP